MFATMYFTIDGFRVVLIASEYLKWFNLNTSIETMCSFTLLHPMLLNSIVLATLCAIGLIKQSFWPIKTFIICAGVQQKVQVGMCSH